MSDESRILAGILILSLVTVETGGLYLVRLWRAPGTATAFQIGFARAGHAHAGVLLLLGLLCQVYADQTAQSGLLDWLSRSGVPVAAILMPAGFFAASAGAGRERPNGLIAVVYAGAAVLAVGLTSLGVGLLTA
jgi:Ni,Fe-hydrogenase I cytochrome b subunit